MLFLATTDDTEVSECLRYRITWHQAGFGISVAKAYCGDTLIGAYAGCTSRQQAQDQCTEHSRPH